MANKDVNIKIKADSKEAQNGIKKATAELNKFTKNVKNNDVAKFAKSFSSATAAIGTTVAALKKVVSAVKDTTEVYKTQLKAETQLETAAKNNPYLNERSVSALKEYASYLQSISTVGDEQLIPMMAQLASAGRTQEEIQKIISAALDVSASGMMSLDSAVTALNKTYSGSVGLLGNQIDGLKNLTTEQLKHGDAVQIIADKYKGMSEEVTKASGSYEQMKNAQGDFLEVVGKFVKPTSDLWNNFWKGWYERGVESVNKLSAKIDANTIGKKLAGALTSQMANISDSELKFDYAEDALDIVTEEELQALYLYISAKKERNAEEEKLLEVIKYVNKHKKYSLELDDQAHKAEEESIRLEQEKNAQKKAAEKRDKEALDFMNKNQKALDTRLEQMRIGAELRGEEIDQQEVLNAMMDSYVQLVTGSDLVTENNPFSQKRLAEIQAYAEGMEKVAEATEEVVDATDNLGDGGSANSLEDFLGKVTELSSYLDQVSQITSQATELFMGSIKDQTSEEQTELAQQYTDGLISYEEYCEKKKQINKKAAQEEYKLKMWEWSASLLAATANIAQGVTAALTKEPPASYIMAALTAASGAIQLATLTANKPKPPQFANGGFVPGTSYSGDNVPVLANSGELILNQKEQAVLKSFMGNNGGGTVVNMPINIENNSSASVSTSMSKNGLRIMIDDLVNASMSEGRYIDSMNIAKQKAAGASYF